MILGSFTTGKNVTDDKLWEMMKRANDLTQGDDFSGWAANSLTLLPLLKRILARAREVKDWQVYFYVMSRAFWYIGWDEADDPRFAFQMSEMFQQANVWHLAEETTRLGRESYVECAARILHLYMQYPQIDDAKMQQMLAIFLESDEKYGTDWNKGSYDNIMLAALFERDLFLAGKAKKKLESLDFTSWCYVCYYVRPMLGYYVYVEDYDSMEELILRVARKEIAKKYQWCYDQCEQANEGTLVTEALRYCMDFGKVDLFQKIFEKWGDLFKHPMAGGISTCGAMLHAFAGDLSRMEETLQVAEEDDRKRKAKKITPYDEMYWFLWWHFYFRLLEKQGVESVNIRLAEETEASEEYKTGGEVSKDGRRSCSCRDLSIYFVEKADAVGGQMSRSRKKFDYEKIKESHKICLGLL